MNPNELTLEQVLAEVNLAERESAMQMYSEDGETSQEIKDSSIVCNRHST